MTDISKVKNYYSKFDEWARLERPEGKLEFEIVIDLIKKYMPSESLVFDLGGGPGRYTAELSKCGYKMHLADLSKELIDKAKTQIKLFGNPDNVINIETCNALDLSKFQDESFDSILLFGPLYHLTTDIEIKTCLQEVSRVLKKGGKIFAIYIPWLAGLSGVIERSFYHPDHVSSEILLKTQKQGIFNNKTQYGFQEGSYIKSDKLEKYMEDAGFSKILLRSIRGLGYKQEKDILSLKDEDNNYYKTMLKIMNDTSTESSVIETCGHAIYIGEKLSDDLIS